MKLDILIPVLLGRRVLVFWVFFIVAAFGTALNFWIPRQFTGTASLLVDTKTANFGLLSSIGEATDQRFLREQVALISSYSMALKVVESLGLDKSTEARLMAAAKEDTGESGNGVTLKHWLATALLKKIQVRTSSDSNVVEVEFTSTDPRLAATIANSFVQAYIKTVTENQSNSSKRQNQLVQRQLSDLREGISNVEKNIYDLQQREDYLAIGDRFDTESKRLRDLGVRLINTQPTIDPALTQLRIEYEAQKTKVANINSLLANLKVQQSNLEAMRRSHDLALQHFWQESLNQHPDAFTVVILRAAEVTDAPTLPKLWINLPLCFLIGGILGIAAAMLAEFFDRRIRTETDAGDVLRVPVLASVIL